MTLSNQGSGKFALVNEGSQIFTKEETDNMDDWVKFGPAAFMELMGKESRPLELSPIEMNAELWRNFKLQVPAAEKKSRFKSVSVENFQDFLEESQIISSIPEFMAK